MATRGTRRQPFKTLHPKPPRVRRVRIHVDAKLAPNEIEKLKEKAATEMRSIGGEVAFVVIRDLRRGGGGRRRLSLGVRKDHQRVGYQVAVSLTPEHRERLEARAMNEARSVSNYVTRLVLDDLRRG